MGETVNASNKNLPGSISAPDSAKREAILPKAE